MRRGSAGVQTTCQKGQGKQREEEQRKLEEEVWFDGLLTVHNGAHSIQADTYSFLIKAVPNAALGLAGSKEYRTDYQQTPGDNLIDALGLSFS